MNIIGLIVGLFGQVSRTVILLVTSVAIVTTVVIVSPRPSGSPAGIGTHAATDDEYEHEGTKAATMSASQPAPTGVATMAATAKFTYIAIVLEGPVEDVQENIDVIIVRGMKVKVHHGDISKLKIKIGNWVRINGNSEYDDDQIVIVAIIIIVVDAPTVIIVPAPSGGSSGGQQGGMGGMGDDD
jgi:hypothetical protein